MNTIQKTKQAMSADARERLSRFTEEARARLKKSGTELLDDAQVRGERALKGSRSWISKNPGAAVAYAFVAGAVAFGWLTRGKSED